MVRIPPPKKEISRKPWGSDYDNYEDYYYEEDEVRQAYHFTSLQSESIIGRWNNKLQTNKHSTHFQHVKWIEVQDEFEKVSL